MEPGVARGEAGALFDSASERFRDVTCFGLLNWCARAAPRARGRRGRGARRLEAGAAVGEPHADTHVRHAFAGAT